MATNQETQEAMINLMKQMQTAGKERKPLKGSAKWITLAILCLAFGFGVLGSFEAMMFNMDAYVKFLSSFAWFFGPLVISVGVGTTAKKVTDTMTERAQIKKEEELAKQTPPEV